MGYQAGQSNTSGSVNNFLGYQAGQSNTTGNDNNFFGKLAGQSNTTGHNNNFFGNSAGLSNTTGYENNFFGSRAGESNVSGKYNHFFGYHAGYTNSSGLYNIFLGYKAGYSGTNNLRNIFIGFEAGYNETLSNRLHIANNRTTSLIYGEFDNSIIKVNGKLKLRDVTTAADNWLLSYNETTDDITKVAVGEFTNTDNQTLSQNGDTTFLTNGGFVVGSGANFATTDFEFNENRTHELNGKKLTIQNGSWKFGTNEDNTFIEGGGTGINISADDGVIISSDDPKINAVSDLTLNSPLILLPQLLPENNELSDLIGRNSNGRLETRSISSLIPTATNGLDTINGSIGLGGALTIPTSIQGNGNHLSFNELGDYRVRLDNNGPEFIMQSTGVSQWKSNETILQGQITRITNSVGTVIVTPKITLLPAPPLNNTVENILVHNASTGELQIRDASTLSAIPSNGLEIKADGSIGLGGSLTEGVYINGGNLASFYVVSVDEFEVEAQSSLSLSALQGAEFNFSSLDINSGTIHLNSGNVILSQPLTQTTTEDAILVRNATTGVIEQRDAATLEGQSPVSKTTSILSDDQSIIVSDVDIIFISSDNGNAANRTVILDPGLYIGQTVTILSAGNAFQLSESSSPFLNTGTT